MKRMSPRSSGSSLRVVDSTRLWSWSSDSANVAWDIQSPACAGETGQAIPALSGGTPPWSADWAGLDPAALPAGVHAVVLTDSLGCSLTIPWRSNLPTRWRSMCPGPMRGLSDTAQVDLQVTGGNPPFSVLWAGGLSDGMLISPDLVGVACGRCGGLHCFRNGGGSGQSAAECARSLAMEPMLSG